MNKLRSSNIVRPDAREDGFVRTSNITKFLASCASYGMANEDLFLRDDLVEGTREGAARVARTVTKLVAFVEACEAEGTVKRVERERAEERTREKKESRERTVTPETQRVVGGGWSGGEKVWLRGQGLGNSAGTYSSRASASTPNLVASQPSTSPVRKRWSPSENMTPLRSYSPDDSPKSGNIPVTASEEHLQDAEVKPVPVPHILKPPPRSPLRNPSVGMDKAGLFSWARSAASPVTTSRDARSSVADSTRASIGDASLRDEIISDYRQNQNHHPSLNPILRQSVLSLQTETTATSGAPSILFEASRSSSGNYPHGSGANNTFGTVRTMTTDLTSEAPSVSRTEGSAMAEEIKKKRTNDFGLFTGAERGAGGSPGKGMMMYNGLGGRKMSEAPILDLSRVAEETDESVSSKGHHPHQQLDERASKPTPINLRKGKWPDDFIDAFHSRDSPPSASSTPPMPISPRHQQPSPFNDDEANNSSRQSTPNSISSPRKLAIVGAHRRPTHRPLHSIDSTPSSGLLPKERDNMLFLRREASPDSPSPSSSPSRVVIKRHNLKHGGLGMGGAGRAGVSPIPRSVSHGFEDSRSSPDSEGTGTSRTAGAATQVPFPRSVSAEGGTPSPRSSSAIGGADNNLDSRPRLIRGRFQSDIEGSSSAAARRRARPSSYDELGASRTRFESMVNLGATSGTTSASDLMMPPRDSIDGSAVRARLVVREDGKPPTHFVRPFFLRLLELTIII